MVAPSAETPEGVATQAPSNSHTVDEGKLNVTSVLAKSGAHAIVDHATDADEEILLALGYKQEFKRYSVTKSTPANITDGQQGFHMDRVVRCVVLGSWPAPFCRVDLEL